MLERGEVANSWRTERWDSLRLLTPNWQSRLPGFGYDGDDPDGFMTMPEVIAFIERYARDRSAPVQTRHDGDVGARDDDGYVVDTDQGAWRCPTVVLATGACNVADVPAVADGVPAGVATVTPLAVPQPATSCDDGGVLVVGASATGIQLADEIHRSGRPVTLAVGEHVRVPRMYRGHGHPVVDGRDRPARRALRRGRRHRPGAPAAVAPARRHAASGRRSTSTR